MSETELSPEKKNDGWWISFVLRWALLFSLNDVRGLFSEGNWGLRWAHLFSPDSVYARILGFPDRVEAPYWHGVRVAVQWFAAHAFGLQDQGGQFWGLAIGVLGIVPPAFLWAIFDHRNRVNRFLREGVYLLVRYQLATMMFLYGAAKVIGQQGIPQPAPLEWIRPLGEISSGQLMWTWLGYSPTYHFFAGVNETVGAILLLFRRTTLLGSLLILPVMVFVAVMDTTFHVGPGAAAALWAVGAFYLIARDWRRLTGAFLFGKSTAPPLPKKVWTSPRLAFVGRGLWVVMVAFSLWSYVLPEFKENADIGGRQSPLCGAYRVERFVSDGRVLLEEPDDPARWREVAINWFGDYIRIRRMDDAELLWSADPGDPYRFMVASGHDYRYGDYGRLLAKTAAMQEQLRFKELPNYGSPHNAALLPVGPTPPQTPGFRFDYTRGQFFTLNIVRNGSDHVLLQGIIDGAEISADLVRINNDDFEFFKTREGLP